jgi:catalase
VLKAGNVGKDAGIVDASQTQAFITAAKTRQWERETKLHRLA